MKKYILLHSLFIAVLLFALGCQREELEPSPINVHNIEAKLVQTTKTILEQKEDSYDMVARWQGHEYLYVYCMGGKGGFSTTVPQVKVKSVSENGKAAVFRYEVPADWGDHRSYNISCFTSPCYPKTKGKDLYFNASIQRYRLQDFQVPVYYSGTVDSDGTISAIFHHYYTYELLHIKNTSGTDISFASLGYEATQVWYKEMGAYKYSEVGDNDFVVESPATKTPINESAAFTIPSGGNDVIVSAYIPNGQKIQKATLVAKIDGKTIRSANTKSSNAKLETGYAYHLFAEWDGAELKFVDSSEPITAEYVDLGLSVKWATCNLGARKPEEYGLYYQWGDTQGYGSDTSDGKSFDWSSYKWCNGSETTLTKYNTESSYGKVDNKTILEPEDDAARAALGGFWRMPTNEDWGELLNTDNCSWTYDNEAKGYKVQSLKSGYTDKWIFLPVPGYRINSRVDYARHMGYYWSSSLDSDPSCSYDICITNILFQGGSMNRYYGMPIRPVYGDIKVAPTDINFRTRNIGSRAVATFTVSNTGSTAVNVNIAVPDAPVTSDFSGDITLNAGTNKTVTLTYTPKETGSITGKIKVSTAETTINVAYNGKAVQDLNTYSHEYVDLGLSVKWATCNLGASKPEGSGLFYQWGDTQGYGPDTSDGEYFYWNSYMWCNGSETTLTKYNTKSSYGTVDNKTVVEMEDDPARAVLGDKWRMPTYQEWYEIENNCLWTWTTMNDVNGYKVQSKKTGYTDNWIFLPASGCRDYNELTHVGRIGHYWSSSANGDKPKDAYNMFMVSNAYYPAASPRYICYSIRPVLE